VRARGERERRSTGDGQRGAEQTEYRTEQGTTRARTGAGRGGWLDARYRGERRAEWLMLTGWTGWTG
jgi:hypothetical protein